MKGYYYIRFIIDNYPEKNDITICTDAGAIHLTGKIAKLARKCFTPDMNHFTVKIELDENRVIMQTVTEKRGNF